jgi:hypothetical protein
MEFKLQEAINVTLPEGFIDNKKYTEKKKL